MEEFTIRLGKRLRALREGRELTREVLSEMAGISPNYLGEIERGEVNVSAVIVNRLVVALDVPITVFYLFDHIRSRNELEAEILSLVKNAEDEDLEKIYRILLSVLQ